MVNKKIKKKKHLSEYQRFMRQWIRQNSFQGATRADMNQIMRNGARAWAMGEEYDGNFGVL